MCRNIRTLANFDPPASEQEVHDAALQFVRKIAGMHAPSKANAEAFERAVREVATTARTLLAALEVKAPPRNREVEAAKAIQRSKQRWSRS